MYLHYQKAGGRPKGCFPAFEVNMYYIIFGVCLICITPMRRYFLLCTTLTTLIACNNNNPTEEGAPQRWESTALNEAKQTTEDSTADEEPKKTVYVDSFRIEMDSLLKADIDLPPIYSHEIISANHESTEKFAKLAGASGGRMRVVVNSSLVAKEVVHTINTVSAPKSDLVLLIDKTGSMLDDIENVKQSLGQILDTIKKYKGTRVAVAVYGDKIADGKSWFDFREFGTDYIAAASYITGIHVNGGGDWPESAYEAIMEVLEQPFWQSAKKRNIILVGDAPPIEKPRGEFALNDIVAKAREGKTVMNFYPIIITPEVRAARVNPVDIVKYQPLKLTSSLYPNPTRGHIDIGFQENGTYYIEIYNVAGEMIVSEEKYGISWGKDLGDDLPNGMYIARVIDKNHHYELLKFVLER